MRYRRFQAGLVAIAILNLASTDGAAQSPEARLYSGTKLAQQLEANVTTSWTNAPLAGALESLSRAQHVAIVLDRRVDPERALTLALSSEPLGEALARIAGHLGLGYSQLGAVAYIGPKPTAERLRTVAALRLEDARQLPGPVTSRVLTLGSPKWEDLAEPRQLVRKLAEDVEMELVGAERIPHDLWAAAQLPSLSWLDRLTLILAQFDLTYRFRSGGRQVELVDWPHEARIARDYRAPSNAAEQVQRWKSLLPGAQILLRGNSIYVEGTLEEHALVESRLRGAPTRRTQVTPGEQRFQLTVENAALSKIMAQLARQTDLEVRWDERAIEQAGKSIDQVVSVKVADASLAQLLDAVFRGTGLKYELRGRVVTIQPAR